MDFFGDPLRNLTFFRPEARTSSEQRLLGWNAPPHELQYIPDHWLTYPEPPKSVNYLLGLLYIFFFIMATAGNGLVIYVFCAAKGLRTPSNILVINLAICDFLMMSKTPIFIYNSFNCGFAMGQAGCQVYGFIGAYTGIAASMTNAFIAYDRFNAIARPLEGNMTHVKAFIIVIFIYMYATPFVFLPATRFWGQFVPEHWLTHAEPEKSMHYLLALVYTTFMIASLTGNGLVIWIFMSAKPLRTPSNIFIVNLAILDFLMMLKAPIFIYNSLNFGFALGNVGCQLFASIGAYSGIGAGLTNAFIGYDRYNVITRPMQGKLSLTKALCFVAFIWIYCTPWALMPMFQVWGRFVPGLL